MVKRDDIGADVLNSDGQKTHYWINAPKRRKKSLIDAVWHRFDRSSNERQNFFFRAFDGLESDKSVERRYKLFLETWRYQEARINGILEESNKSMFRSFLDFVLSDFKHEELERPGAIRSEYKLPVGFLLLGTNRANNIRLIEEFTRFVKSSDMNNVKLVKLDSKNCANVKSTLREIVKQILKRNVSDEGGDAPTGTEDDENEEDVSNDDESDDDDYDGRINYDFEIVEDWCLRYFSKEKSTFKDTKLRLVIVLQDLDSISNQVLNQVIKLLHSYSKTLPLKLIMGLSSPDTDDWIATNLSNKFSILIDIYKFSALDSSSLGLRLLNEALLGYDFGKESSFLIESKLASIILNRYMNSNNSIDILLSELKLCYMIHFYQQPLSTLIDSSQAITKDHLNALRMLPSFKKWVERLIFEQGKLKSSMNGANQLEKVNSIDEKVSASRSELNAKKSEVRNLLENDAYLADCFRNARDKIQKFKLVVLNLMNIAHKLQCYNEKCNKVKLEIYKMIVSDQLMSSIYLKDLLNSKWIEKNEDLVAFLNSDELFTSVEDLEDEYLIALRKKLEITNPKENLSEVIASYMLNVKDDMGTLLDKQLFCEVFTLDGGAFANLDVNIEENFENLMINLVRPKLRGVLELGLNDPGAYLNNDLIASSPVSPKPIITQLFKVYKDAPSTINLYDFFIAFKESLDKTKILEQLWQMNSDPKHVQLIKSCAEEDVSWNKLVYSWFLQSCLELIHIGFLKEKAKNDYLEKAIWINL